MNAINTGVMALACGFSVVASAAEIMRTTVRQRWPFSQVVDVDYVLSCDPREDYDVAPAVYSGETRLNLEGCAIGGERHNISDGAHSLSIDFSGSKFANMGKIPALRVELELVESPLYMLVDIRKNGADAERVTCLTRSDILTGTYGPYETDMTKFGIAECGLENPIVWTGVTNDTKYLTTHMVFRRIKRGSFAAGESPADNVSVTRPYWLSVFEWTYGYHYSVNGSTPVESRRQIPVWNISTTTMRGSTNASAGVNWPETGHSKVGGIIKTMRDMTGLLFDVPTEAQWELASRAGTATPYCRGAGETASFSNAVADAVCRYRYNGGWGYGQNGDFKWLANESSFSRCGSYAPNAYGMYDMLGNVAEVCLDWFAPVDSACHVGRNPVGPSMAESSSRKRVARGGSAWDAASDTVVTKRGQAGQDENSSLYGFRLAVMIEPAR